MTKAAISTIRRWREDPVAFVREVIGVEPDAWQVDVLRAFPKSPRAAMKACKGPGKTAVLSWIAWNFLVTRPHPKVVATSITSDNLADGLWTEMASWQNKSQFLREAFTWGKTRIFNNEHPETWWMSARTWPKGGSVDQQADTLAGLHADYVLFILDECGGIPDAVMAAAEAGLANAGTGGGQEAHIVIAGNPTHLAGPLYRSCTTERDMWHVTEITSDPDDPKRTPRVSAEWAREQIKKYGRDNPWVLVNVFGKFPPSSANALLGPDEVREAMARVMPYHTSLDCTAKIIGIDVAREGGDQSCIVKRQGRYMHPPIMLRNVDSIQGSGRVMTEWREWDADACFIDNTGGFGGGWLDQLRSYGRAAVGIHFAGKPDDPRYYNKRAEMWFRMAEWVKSGGCLPDVPELVAELTEPVYYFKGDRVILEDKDQIRAKLGRSPDIADSLCLTFAADVYVPTDAERMFAGKDSSDFDPWA